MKCADCPFVFNCWAGRLGEDLMTRRSVTFCHICGRMVVHIMGLFVGQLNPRLPKAQKSNWHYHFFCEQRSTPENKTYFRRMRTRALHNGRDAAITKREEFNFATPVGITACFLCQREWKDISSVVDLDKNPEAIREGLR